MTWKLTDWAKTRSPATGVPWRDLTDKEFAAVEALFPKGVLREHGYFYHEMPKEEEPPAPARRTGRAEPEEPPASPPAEEEVSDD